MWLERSISALLVLPKYLNDPEKNKEKFTDNWFVDNKKWMEADKANDQGEPWRKYYKGPRDRFYVTGDLGEYRPDGAVRVLGRMGSQVKVDNDLFHCAFSQS